MQYRNEKKRKKKKEKWVVINCKRLIKEVCIFDFLMDDSN